MNALIVPLMFGSILFVCLTIILIERWMTPSHAKGWIEPYHEQSLSKHQRIFFDGIISSPYFLFGLGITFFTVLILRNLPTEEEIAHAVKNRQDDLHDFLNKDKNQT